MMKKDNVCRVAKKMCAVFALLLLMVCVTACGKKQEDNKDDTGNAGIEGLVSDGKLTFVVDDSVVPCVYRNDKDELEGFEYDCGNAIAKYLKLEPVWICNAWENLITTVQSGKADAVIDGLYITDKRKEAVNFCESYYSMNGAMVVAAGNDSIYKPEDLVGKRVGAQPASGELDILKSLGVENIIEYSRVPDGIQDIKNDRIDAFVIENLSAVYYSKNGEYEVRQEEPIGSFEIGIATNKNTPEVTEAINSAIRALKKDGTFSDISKKWFDEDITKK